MKQTIANFIGYETRLGVKRVTEPNRTEPPDYTGQSLRKFPIVAVPVFTAVTEPNRRMRYVSCLFSIISYVSFKIQLRTFLDSISGKLNDDTYIIFLKF